MTVVELMAELYKMAKEFGDLDVRVGDGNADIDLIWYCEDGEEDGPPGHHVHIDVTTR
jgi:hypothetical protein